jgi:hypothetical protein
MMTLEGLGTLLEWIGSGLAGLLMLVCALMFWALAPLQGVT